MHQQHDDPLERELEKLSRYTGEPASIWRDAIERHRREQQQKLWVWVRRPAPALAAAALALMVAAIAVRPIDPTVAERRAALKDALNSWGAEPTNTLADRPVAPDVGGRDADRLLSRNAAAGARVPTARPANERFADPTTAREPIATNFGLSGGAIESGPTTSGAAPVSDKDTPAIVDRSAGNRDRGGQPPQPSAATAARSGPAGNAPAPSISKLDAETPSAPAAPAPAPEPALAIKGEKQPPPAPGADLAAKAMDDALSPLEVTAEVRLQVPDVASFYNNVVPSLVDVKNGESFASTGPESAKTKDTTAADARVLNLTLRVGEERLPQVLEELRRQSTVISQTAQTPPQAERLRQIDTLVELNKIALKQASVEAKSAPAPSKSAPPPSDASLKQVTENLAQLNDRRQRVERGNDFATVNIIALADVSAEPRSLPPASAQPTTAAGASLTQGDSSPLRKLQAGVAKAESSAAGAARSEVQPTPGPEEGKIKRAAKEGWSSLGDTTADFVRSAIGTMIYWVPALIACMAAWWWLRRRAAASMREPPPL